MRLQLNDSRTAVLLGRCGICPQTQVLAVEASGHWSQEPLNQTLHRAPQTLGSVRVTKGTFNMWIPRPMAGGSEVGKGPGSLPASWAQRSVSIFQVPSALPCIWLAFLQGYSLDVRSSLSFTGHRVRWFWSQVAQETTLVRERGE